MQPKDRVSRDLFQKFMRTVPAGVIPSGPTVQGVYCMTPDGDFLSGYFAWAFKDKALGVIRNGWNRFEQLARQKNWRPKPVPRDTIDFALGKPTSPGGLKLQATVRDLPRGKDRQPGNNEFQKCAHNINWVDFTPEEARSFLTDRLEPSELPASILQRFSHTLKDCVRGQCSDWDKKKSRRAGDLYTQLVKQDARSVTLRLTGHADLSQPGRAYLAQLHGQVVYDKRAKRFTSFQLVASGQRRGQSQFNFRKDDPGPAPMGVSYRLHVPSGG